MEDLEIKQDQDINEEASTELEETYKEMSPFRLILRRFFRSRLSVVGLIMLVFLFMFSFLGPVVYDKWGEIEADRTQVVNEITKDYTFTNEYGEEITITQNAYIETDNIKAKPSKDHLLGTDTSAMDIFTRLMYGGRISLTIGFALILSVSIYAF